MKIDNTKKKKGFSLVEVLISLFILAVGFVSVLGLMVSNAKNSDSARNQIIASQLAQEGNELFRNLKEGGQNFLNGDYANDYLDNAPVTVAAATTSQLFFRNNFYTRNTSGTKTKYLRVINVNNTTKTVTTKVSWNGTSIPTPCNAANKCLQLVSVFQ